MNPSLYEGGFFVNLRMHLGALEGPILKTMTNYEASPLEVTPVAASRTLAARDRDVVLSLLPVRGGLLPRVLGLAL